MHAKAAWMAEDLSKFWWHRPIATMDNQPDSSGMAMDKPPNGRCCSFIAKQQRKFVNYLAMKLQPCYNVAS